MWNFRKRPWLVWSVLILSYAIALAFLSSLIYFTKRVPLDPGDTVQIIALVVLVAVTLWYAISTARIHGANAKQVVATQTQATVSREQAQTSRESLEIALNAEKNAVVPIIKLTSRGTSSSGGELQSIEVGYANIGKGPALNLRAWLLFQADYSDEDERTGILPVEVIAVEESNLLLWLRNRNTTLLPASASDFDIVAEYSDIYEQHFCSRLSITPGQDPKFFFGKIPERTFPLV